MIKNQTKKRPKIVKGTILALLACTGMALWATASAAPLAQQHERYLDRMALIDARKDFTQSPSPSYVLDKNAVLRFSSTASTGLIIIGDSILTGWSGYFAHIFPNALIDGRVGRQFSSIIPIWESLQKTGVTRHVGYVVVELGTNGTVSPQNMRTFLHLAGNRQILLVVPEMPRPWEHEVQQLYFRTAAMHQNVHLVRWDLLSRNHPNYYWTDEVHPDWMGIQVMVHAIAVNLQQVLFEQKTRLTAENVRLNREVETSKKEAS
ncbi:acyltransferase [Acidithiobacillus thiooxidans]|uniref:acyltransferase n=1 Tax=Acidithiobacillus thiooxidans TaxID=930 RepID=UPI001594A278|nr:acyltransferase [Acidithiobacillus thiooxidans]